MFWSAPKITTSGWFRTRTSANRGLQARLCNLRNLKQLVAVNSYQNRPHRDCAYSGQRSLFLVLTEKIAVSGDGNGFPRGLLSLWGRDCLATREAIAFSFSGHVKYLRGKDWIWDCNGIGFENIRIRPSTRFQILCVLKIFHYGQRTQKIAHTCRRGLNFLTKEQ